MPQLSRMILAARHLGSFLTGIVRAYAEVFFLSRTMVGLVLVVGTLLNWDVGAAGLISVASACLFAKLTKLESRTLQAGYYTYNPLLVGLSLGAVLSLSWLTAVLIAVAGVMTYLLTAGLVHLLRYYLNLPALSLPFVLASAATHTAALRYAGLTPAPRKLASFLVNDFGLPTIVAGFLKTVGAVFFVPSVLVGGLFAAMLLVRSRILFGLAVGGYLVGTTLRGALLGSWQYVYGDIMSFNFLLTAMAVGGIFLIPSITSFVVAMAAVAVSIVLVDATQVFSYYFAVPAYTLPFNLATLGVVYALSVNRFPGMTKYFAACPEETLENELVRRARFDAAGRPLALPFHGRWTVWQGFDGKWTHQGTWRYAYDFVITDEEGNTHSGTPTQLRDFYCYRKPVLSPCRGRVVAVVDDLPDNPPGRVDKANNWGNYVLIYDDRGFYVELSHFAYASIRVGVGDRVQQGTVLGLCGNSGYSPQPHLHIHVQATERIGDETLPFSFARYLDDKAFTTDGRPPVGAEIESAELDDRLDSATDFLLNETYRFDVRRDGLPAGIWDVTVKMAVDGTFYFESSRGGKLFFGKLGGTFFCYRSDGNDEVLNLIGCALPKLPLVRTADRTWSDVVPVGRAAGLPRRTWLRMLSPWAAQFGTATTRHRYVGRNLIETVLTVPGEKPRFFNVELDCDGGWAAFRSERLEIRAITPAEEATAEFYPESSDATITLRVAAATGSRRQ